MNKKDFTLIGVSHGSVRCPYKDDAIAHFTTRTKEGLGRRIVCTISLKHDVISRLGYAKSDKFVLAILGNKYYLLNDNVNGMTPVLSGDKTRREKGKQGRYYVNFSKIDQKFSPLTINEINNGARVSIIGKIDLSEKIISFDLNERF